MLLVEYNIRNRKDNKMTLTEWRKKSEQKKYERCKKLVSYPEFEYDVDIMLFISTYEILQDPEPRES